MSVKGGVGRRVGGGSCLSDVGPGETPIGSEQLLQLYFILCYLRGPAAASDLGCDLQQV